MNKNWRLTAAFGAALVVLSAVYFLSSPPATTPIEKLDDHVLPGLLADQITKVEVARKGEGTMTFERGSDVVGDHWKIAEQAGHAAEPAMVQQLLFALDRYVKTGGLDAGKPETAPELTGLADPRLTVTYSTKDGRREVLRFGKQPPTNSTAVFYQKEGDPKIYLVGVETYDAFVKPALQYRAKNLVRYAPHRINKIALEYKFIRPQGKGKPDLIEYEKSVLERYEEGAERGWYLVSPHKERLYDHSVAAMVTRLADLQATDYQPVGELKEKGLTEPEVKVALYGAGDTTPVEIHFGAPAERGRKRWVWSPGAAEVALYDSGKYEEIPLQRASLRVKVVFPFSTELVKHLEIEAKDLGRVVLDRKEQKKDGDPVSTWKWEVVEPKDLKVESERLEAFVAAIVTQEIQGFLGAQDFKQAGLDPAPIKLTVETKENKKHVCWFAGTRASGFLRKEGVDEIYEVRPELVRILERLELNFVSLEMFNVPRDSIRMISFDAKGSSELRPQSFKLEKQEGKWVFTDLPNKGAAANPEKLESLLTVLNYIRADALIGRDSKTITDNLLDERTAPATLRMSYVIGSGPAAKEGDMELYISVDKSDKPTQHKFYARLKDNLAVFQVNPQLVMGLQQFLRIPEKEDDKEK